MGEVMSENSEARVDRREFVASLMAACPQALVITGLGSPAYDVFAAGDRPGNFYLWGAMGGAAVMGLGLALAQPQRSVLVVTGDGEALMGMGALATIGAQRPANLGIVILDNGHFGETGMQRSHSSLGTSLSAVARACGIPLALELNDMQGAQQIARHSVGRDGCFLARVSIRAEEMPRALPSRDGPWLKDRFRQGLGLSPF